MEARELRIGNYFNCPNEKQNPFRIDCIDFLYPNDGFGKLGMFQKGFENTHPLTWYFKDLTPIPLTQEWLLKFGFEKEEEQDELLETFMLHKNNIHRIEFSENHKTIYWHENYTSIYHQEIKYVHQLQNLYFALIGEELTIK